VGETTTTSDVSSTLSTSSRMQVDIPAEMETIKVGPRRNPLTGDFPIIVFRPLRFPDPALLPGWPNFQVPRLVPTMPNIQKARKLPARTLVSQLMDMHRKSSLEDMTVRMALGWSANARIGEDGPACNLYPESTRTLSDPLTDLEDVAASFYPHPAAKETGAMRERVEMAMGERKKRGRAIGPDKKPIRGL
jgi:hypothetical protein